MSDSEAVVPASPWHSVSLALSLLALGLLGTWSLGTVESRSLGPGSQAQKISKYEIFFENLSDLFMEYAKMTG